MVSMNDRLHTSTLSALQQAEHAAAVNGAKILLHTLIERGVDTVFGYPGGAVLPLYDALYAEPRLRHVLVRHEQAAVHAAEGYARTTGRPGVVFVTSGPGMANTTSGLLDAMCDSVPVLCISGQVSTAAIGTDAFQECDAIGISRSVTKWNTQIRAVQDVAEVVGRAFDLTRQGRPGPVLVDFPKDIQLASPADAPQGEADPARRQLAALRARRQGGKAATRVPQGAVRRAAALLAQARRPVFYGGGGLVNSGPQACAAFTELVRQSGAPCTLTLMGLGAFPASDPQFVGMLGMHGTLEANLAMHNADLVVCIGARFDDRITGKLSEFCPHARKIHIDIDPASINKVVRVDVALVGDCLPLVQALRDEMDTWHGIQALLLGRSAQMQKVRRTVMNLASTSADVVIYGETGTGKDLVARCLHDHSDRRRAHYVPLNCGGLPENLLDSELFGHEPAHRQVRTCARRHAVPRRDREHADGRADQAAARAAGAQHRASGFEHAGGGELPRDRRGQAGSETLE